MSNDQNLPIMPIEDQTTPNAEQPVAISKKRRVSDPLPNVISSDSRAFGPLGSAGGAAFKESVASISNQKIPLFASRPPRFSCGSYSVSNGFASAQQASTICAAIDIVREVRDSRRVFPWIRDAFGLNWSKKLALHQKNNRLFSNSPLCSKNRFDLFHFYNIDVVCGGNYYVGFPDQDLHSVVYITGQNRNADLVVGFFRYFPIL